MYKTERFVLTPYIGNSPLPSYSGGFTTCEAAVAGARKRLPDLQRRWPNQNVKIVVQRKYWEHEIVGEVK